MSVIFVISILVILCTGKVPQDRHDSVIVFTCPFGSSRHRVAGHLAPESVHRKATLNPKP